ncbi:MAG: AAA family ATPase, partial [Myxococcota bacterium]
FGKSTFLSMLHSYYDLKQKDDFERLFGELAIGKNPTPEHNRYLVLRLEFTGLSTGGTPETLASEFLERLRLACREILWRYRAVLPSPDALVEALQHATSPSGLLLALISVLSVCEQKAYILIDEYDNFTNDLIFRGHIKTYEQLLHATGWVREFYKTLKEGATLGVIARIFITGVAPVTLDDLGSGANIFKYLYLSEPFQAMTGFTEEEVRALLKPRLQEMGVPEQLEETLEVLRHHYDGYRFTPHHAQGIFNPILILHFFSQYSRPGVIPPVMLDHNLRMDYGRLRMLLSGREPAPRPINVKLLLEVLETGELTA